MPAPGPTPFCVPSESLEQGPTGVHPSFHILIFALLALYGKHMNTHIHTQTPKKKKKKKESKGQILECFSRIEAHQLVLHPDVATLQPEHTLHLCCHLEGHTELDPRPYP